MQRREDMTQAEVNLVKEFNTTFFWGEFRSYVKDNNLIYRKLSHNSWIFWNSLTRDPDLNNKIVDLLENMLIMKACLIQFWRASEVGDGRRLFLTTRDQPFVIIVPEDEAAFSKGLCSYRMKISLRDYDINTSTKEKAEKKETAGVIDRVFRNQRIEFSLNVSYYSSEDYPQRELASSSGVRSSIVLPFSDSNGHPIGAIEIVSQSELDPEFCTRLQEIVFSDSLKKKGLAYRPVCKDLCENYRGEDVLIRNPKSEITDVLKVIDANYDLLLAQAWTLCRCCEVFSHLGSVDQRHKLFPSSSFTSQNNFLLAQRFCPLKKGEGVVGNTILSPGLVYCENVAKFSIVEYPLAHFARHDNLSTCFAIRLQSTLAGNQVYVLELFLHRSNFNDNKATLISILEFLALNIRTFKVVSSDEVEDYSYMPVVDPRIAFRFETLETTKDKKDVAVVISESQRSSKGKLLEDNSRGKSPIEVIDAELSLRPLSVVTIADTGEEQSNIDSSQLGSRKSGIPISLEELKRVSGMKRKEAAADLGVSVSTLKRVCREFDISRWPPRKKSGDNQFPSKDSVKSTSSKQTLSGCESIITNNETLVKSMTKYIPASYLDQKESLVTIKAKYGDHFIKFPFSTCCGINEFYQQVSKRLPLEVGKYIVRYEDEDGDAILITCDEDLRLYICHLVSLGKSTVIVTLELRA